MENWLVGINNMQAVSVSVRGDTVGIGARALAGCEQLRDILIPSSVKTIGNRAFYNCTALRAVVFGNGGVESIGEYAFAGCTALQSFQLGDSLKVIGSYAFYGCTSITSTSFIGGLPDCLERIGTYAFYGSGIWQRTSGVVYVDDWAVGLNSSDMYITLDSKTRGIADYAFYGAMILEVAIPDSVEIVGRAAFYNCMFLMDVKLSGGMGSIPDYMFYGCMFLSRVTIPECVTSIGRSAFYNCLSLAEIIIPDSVTRISDYAFYGSGLRNVIIGGGVEEIGENIFSGCSNLQSVRLGDGLEALGARMFYRCESLKEVNFGSGLKRIGNYAFYGCSSLDNVSLPASVTSVGNYAFYGCVSLKSFTLNKGLTQIGISAFLDCKSLETVVVPSSVASIGNYAFRGCTSLSGITIGAQVSYLGNHVFYGCNSLTIYCESKAAGAGWGARWNSGYRPVVFGCVLSGDKSYVVSVTKGEIENYRIVDGEPVNVITAPTREGYDFVGWTTTAGGTSAEYTADKLNDAPDGTVLYAVWTEKTEEQPAPEEDVQA